MIKEWKEKVNNFVILAHKHNVKMLLVGGGAVNFHGYQRHSADVDFWIETTDENLNNLIKVFQEIGYDIKEFPPEIKNQLQNISVKFSPSDFDIELITRFSLDGTFDEVLQASEKVIINNNPQSKINVLSISDLINSKIKAGRPKDLLDIQQLKEINNLK